MPAGVIPFITTSSGIRVEATGKYVVGCVSCRWMPDFYFDPEIATRDAEYHNHVHHDDAPVEAEPEFHPLRIVNEGMADVRKAERYARVLAIGYVPFIALLALMVGFPWPMAIATVVWGAALVLFGRRWGEWNERLAFAKTQREAFVAAVEQINSELG